MKVFRLICLLSLGLLFGSCAKHIQIFHTQSDQLALDKETKMRFHGNEHLNVYYDFWSEGGVMLFFLQNKTDSTLYLDFEKSYVIINQREVNYYADQNEGARRPDNNPNESNAISTYFHELPRVLEMPSQSGQWVEGYPLSYDWYPMKNKESYQYFSRDKSPLQIEHKLVYTFRESDITSTNTLKHYLWVKAIQQMRLKEFQQFTKQQSNGKGQSNLFYIPNPNAGTSGLESDAWWGQLTIGLLEVITLFL